MLLRCQWVNNCLCTTLVRKSKNLLSTCAVLDVKSFIVLLLLALLQHILKNRYGLPCH